MLKILKCVLINFFDLYVIKLLFEAIILSDLLYDSKSMHSYNIQKASGIMSPCQTGFIGFSPVFYSAFPVTDQNASM